MRALVLNWTHGYHAGCAAVCRSIERILTDAGCEIVGRIKTGRDAPDRFADAELVVVNGEGTLHHEARNAQTILRQMIQANEAGLRTMLVNASWMGMNDHPAWTALRGCSLVTAREPLSAQAMPCNADGVYPDLSLYDVHRPTSGGPHAGKVVLGSPGVGPRRVIFHSYAKYGWPVVTLRGSDFQAVVDELAGAAMYVTGRYHGMYAAVAAGVPVSTQPSNTWKIESTFDWYEQTAGGKTFADWLWERPRLTAEHIRGALA